MDKIASLNIARKSVKTYMRRSGLSAKKSYKELSRYLRRTGSKAQETEDALLRTMRRSGRKIIKKKGKSMASKRVTSYATRKREILPGEYKLPDSMLRAHGDIR